MSVLGGGRSAEDERGRGRAQAEPTHGSATRRDLGAGPVAALAAPNVEDLALHWFDIDEAPRLIVDLRLTIKWLNVSAERELQRRRDIVRRGDLLAAINPVQQAELLAFVNRCGEEPAILCLPSADQGDHLMVRARRLPAESVGLILRRSDDFRPRYADFAAAFQLTLRERRILLQLADGHSASQAAEHLGISTQTVRTHIKNLYAKLGVKCREGLLSRIRAYQM